MLKIEIDIKRKEENKMKKWLSVLLAAVMLMAMAGIAGAVDTPMGTIAVTGLKNGETVQIYKVIELKLSAEATFDEPAWVTGLQVWIDQNYPNYGKPTDLPANGDGKFLNELSGQLTGMTATVSKTMITDGDFNTSELPVGSYVVLVMGGENAHEAYLTSINPESYDYDKKIWNVKNGAVDASKKVKVPEVKKEISQTTATVGDKVMFDIYTDVPTYPANVYNSVVYKIEDIMDEALTFNKDMKVYGVNGENEQELTLGTKEDGKDYSAVYPEAEGNKHKIFELNFNYGRIKDYQKIHVQYTATVNEKIKLNSDENDNEVKFTYDVTTKTDKKKLHSFGIDLTKYEKGSGEILLQGAEFELSKFDEMNGYKKLSFKKVTQNGSDYYVPDEKGTDKLITDKDGKILINGLDVGKYKLKETKAPTGYNLMTNEPEITLAQASTKMWLSNTNNKDQSNSAYWYQPVEDSKISILPSTGGMGTTIFMVAGIGVMACAVAALMLVLKRQKKNEG